MSRLRFVDTVPAPAKPRPLEVLALGMSRTGTMSMCTALGMLGYRSYHMKEAFTCLDKEHLRMWGEAVPAKLDQVEAEEAVSAASSSSSSPSSSLLPSSPPSPPSPLSPRHHIAPYTADDLAKILQDYDAITDIPCILFAEELMAAHPNAKIILTTRDVDRWLPSVRASFYELLSWRVWALIGPLDPQVVGPYIPMLRRVLVHWTGGLPWPAAGDWAQAEEPLRRTFHAHADKIRRLAAEQGREVLEFRATDGWAPLCHFLGKEVPTEPYPHINEGANTAHLHERIVRWRLRDAVAPKVGATLAATSVAALAFWWARCLRA